MQISTNYTINSRPQNANLAFQSKYGLNPYHPSGQMALEILGAAIEGRPYGATYNTPQKPKNSDSMPTRPNNGISKKEYDKLCEEKEAQLLDHNIKINDIKTCTLGTRLVDMDIDDKNYKFFVFSTGKLNALNQSLNYEDENPEPDTLTEQVKNIKDCYRGRFVRIRNEEHFIPFVKDGIPDVKKDKLLIKYGNARTDDGFGGLFRERAKDAIEDKLGTIIDETELKPIEYIVKNPDSLSSYANVENDNTIRKKAFGYYDKQTGTRCIYFYDSKNVVTNKDNN